MRATRNGVSPTTNYVTVEKSRQCHTSSTLVHWPSLTAVYCAQNRRGGTQFSRGAWPPLATALEVICHVVFAVTSSYCIRVSKTYRFICTYHTLHYSCTLWYWRRLVIDKCDTYTHTDTYTYVQIHIHTYVRTYVRTYVHTYIHITVSQTQLIYVANNVCCVYITEQDSSKSDELSTDISPLSVNKSSTHTVCELNSSVCLMNKFVEMHERAIKFMYRKCRKNSGILWLCSANTSSNYNEIHPLRSCSWKFRNWRALWKIWTYWYISFLSAHHSLVFYFRCSVYWWKGSVRF